VANHKQNSLLTTERCNH